MNKYEERTKHDRKSTARFSLMMSTAGAALIGVVILIIGLSGSATPRFWSRAGFGLAISILVIRQIARRMKSRVPKSAQPDPRSRLNLQ